MGFQSTWCSVRDRSVTRVIDFQRETMNVICPEYDPPTGTCRLKKASLTGGPLSHLLERADENAFDSTTTRCPLAVA